MRNLFFILVFLPFFSIGQHKSIKTNDWKIGEIKNIYDSKILRIKGDNNENGITNVGFEVDGVHKGFTIHLYVTRQNNLFSNLKNFSFNVVDSCGNHVLSDTLSFKPGVEFKEDWYYNYGYISSPIETNNVTIYLTDKIGLDGNKEFIFQTLRK